jgi:hypothetical protein
VSAKKIGEIETKKSLKEKATFKNANGLYSEKNKDGYSDFLVP